MVKGGPGGVLIGVLCLLVWAAVSAQGQIHGSSRLDVVAFPIPCTVIDIIKLNTPCERTLLMFDIESIINLNITISGMVLQIDSAIGIAGPEHLILQGKFNLGAVTIHPEMWFAVPFETVVDANSQQNVVVIPPGEVMFVKKRLTTTINIAGITITNLAMFEDVNFPNPGADYPHLFYPVQSQSFAFGDILAVSGQTVSGITITSVSGFCATNAGNSVKKHSAPGSVNPACGNWLEIEDGAKTPLFFDFETISIGGLKVAGIQGGASLSFTPKTGLTLGTSFSHTFFNIATLATSISYSTSGGIHAGSGLSARLVLDPLVVALSFDNSFQLSGASLSMSKTQTLGSVRVGFSGSASLVADQGLTSIVGALSLTQGLFSSNQSASFTRQAVGFDQNNDPIYGLGFGSLSITATLRLTPATLTLSAAFGKKGLTRFAVISGVVF